MARQSILDRFRPVGTPGPGGSTGVPTEDDRGPEWELAPVFAALTAVIQAADATIAEAERSAAQLTATAATHATQSAEQARLDAVSVRASIAAELLDEAHVTGATNLATARKHSASLSRNAHRGLPAAAAHVIDALITDLAPS